jgi:CheY-like chemotaxis protein
MYHILAVDDSRAMRELVALTLRAGGYQVSVRAMATRRWRWPGGSVSVW